MLEGDLLDAKDVQINLQGFMYDKTSVFVSELWDLLLDAQTTPDGIPRIIKEAAAAVKREDERGGGHRPPPARERVIEQRKRGRE